MGNPFPILAMPLNIRIYKVIQSNVKSAKFLKAAQHEQAAFEEIMHCTKQI